LSGAGCGSGDFSESEGSAAAWGWAAFAEALAALDSEVEIAGLAEDFLTAGRGSWGGIFFCHEMKSVT
jgi:hypothetical protein